MRPSKTRFSLFVSLCGLGQNVQFEGRSYWGIRGMIEIQNKMPSRISYIIDSYNCILIVVAISRCVDA